MGALKRVVAIAIAGLLAVAMVAAPVAQAGTPGAAAGKATQRMTEKAAKLYIGRHLKQNYKRYWRNGNHKRIVDCKNLSRIRVRCKVSWYYKDKAYIHGSAIAFYKKNDPVHVFTRDDLKVRAI